MFELPEVTVLARQLNSQVVGRTVTRLVRGNSPHKFVFHNLPAPEYEALAAGKVIGPVTARAKWLFIPLEPGLVQLCGEFGGRLLLHPEAGPRPERHHLLLELDDGRAISAVTQMWGMFALMRPAEIASHKYAGNIGVTPVDEAFTWDYFERLVMELPDATKRSVKGLLTQEGIIPGIGNSYCQDILFRAGIHPRRPVATLSLSEARALFDSVVGVVTEAIAAGGRNDEYDLYGNRGGYVRRMSSATAGQPCQVCGTPILKMQYLGGACYVCPSCQR